METKLYTKEQMDTIIACLQAGEVMAFPTDTVYGLGVCLGHEKALETLKKAKIRPDEKPIPMMVSSIEQIECVAHVNETARQLINAFMPGAFTIVLKRKASIPAYVSNGLPTIAIRMPDDAFVLGLMDGLQKPMLVSSANLSAHHSCQNSDDVRAQLSGRIHGIVVGESKSDVASTIVIVEGDNIQIAREGLITKEAIEKVLKGE